MGLLRWLTGMGGDPRSLQPRLEMLQGIIGFFTVMAVGQALYLNFSGRSSFTALAVMVLFLGLSLWLYRARVKLSRELNR